VPYRRKKLTFAISSPDEFLFKVLMCDQEDQLTTGYFLLPAINRSYERYLRPNGYHAETNLPACSHTPLAFGRWVQVQGIIAAGDGGKVSIWALIPPRESKAQPARTCCAKLAGAPLRDGQV